MWDDGNSLGPKELHNYLARVMYDRRNKFNPLWNSLVLAGIKNGEKYLGVVMLFLWFRSSLHLCVLLPSWIKDLKRNHFRLQC